MLPNLHLTRLFIYKKKNSQIEDRKVPPGELIKPNTTSHFLMSNPNL